MVITTPKNKREVLTKLLKTIKRRKSMKEKSPNKMRGMIKCPCCRKGKVAVYEDSRGHASIQCPKCNRFGLYDFDTLTAIPAGAIIGCTQKYTT